MCKLYINGQIFIEFKESDLFYVHAENQCMRQIFGGQSTPFTDFNGFVSSTFGIKEKRRIFVIF